VHRLVRAAVALCLLAAVLAPQPAGAASCRFALGFAALRAQIPDVVGDCLEDERHDPVSGDAVQRTTGGLLVWRKADNVTAFTDGYRTWLEAPLGLQTRLNGEQLAWERASAAPAAAAAPTAGSAWRREDVAFVFLTGYATSLGAETASPFAALQRQLLARGWPAESFLTFGYAGGAIVEGRWRPRPHGCESTGAPLATGVATLGDLIAAQTRARPSTRFVLVGHSLGGLIGWAYLQALRARPPGSGAGAGGPGGPGAVVGVVTVDAPLRGVGPDKRLAAALSACGGPILDELGALYRDADRLAARWADLAAWAAARGVRVATVGSQGDCLYYPRLPGCEVPYAALFGASDDRETQYVPGAAVRLTIPVDPGWPVLGAAGRVPSAHGAALTLPAFAGRVADEVDLAGRPR
jgi:pimeloyl-ACP methyl ester carboxylesterase